MKKNLLLLFLSFTTLFGFGQELVGVAANTKLKGDSKKLFKQGFQYYEIESGAILFEEQTGATFQMSFDRYGLREVILAEGEELKDGVNSPYKSMSIRDGHIEVFINLLDSTASSVQHWEQLKKTVKENLAVRFENATSEENVIFMDKECALWKTAFGENYSSTNWVWQGVVIKNTRTIRSKSSGYEAKEIILGHEMDESQFKILKSVRIVYPEAK